MKSRQSSSLTREGWYYLAFSFFILGGAALREVNLLVVLGGLMVAPLLLSWRLSNVSLRRMSAMRAIPTRAFVGEPVSIQLHVSNRRHHISCWTLSVEDTIHCPPRTSSFRRQRRGTRMRCRCVIGAVHPQQTKRVSYRATFTRRGRYQLFPIRVSSQFPLGLVRSRRSIDCRDELIVFPRVGRLLPAWHTLLESERSGLQRSMNRQGYVDGDYYGIRDWRSGDNRRWIHWRTTARVGRLSVRQFERQNNPQIALLVDPFRDEATTPATVEKAISFAATIVMSLAREGVSQLAFGIADESEAAVEEARNHRVDTDRLLAMLATAGEVTNTASIESLINSLGPQLGRDVSIVVVSTRPNVFQMRRTKADDVATADSERQASTLLRLLWVDCSSDQFGAFFTLEDPIGRSPMEAMMESTPDAEEEPDAVLSD